MQAAGEIEGLCPATMSPRSCDSRAGGDIRKGGGLDPDEHDGRIREKPGSVLQREGDGELPLRDDEIDRALAVLDGEQPHQLALKLRPMEGIEIEELRVEDDGTWRVGFQRGPEGLVRAHHRWRESSFRVEEQHPVVGCRIAIAGRAWAFLCFDLWR